MSSVKYLKIVGGAFSSASNASDDLTVRSAQFGVRTVLLLHMDGSGASFVDSSLYPHPVNVLGGGSETQTTAQYKFGGSSALFGSSNTDALSIPHSSDFSFGTGPFTVDFWYRPAVVTGSGRFLLYWGSSGYCPLRLERNLTALQLYSSSSGSTWDISNGVTLGTLAANTWYHIALTRTASGNLKAFFDGSLVADLATGGAAFSDYNPGDLYIGGFSGYPACDGYIDEFRIVKGYCAWTTTFTPPTAAYSSAGASSSVAIANGPIESTDGGFKFPDGTTQLTAAAAAPDLSGYALLAGRAAGQTLYGGSAASGNLALVGGQQTTSTLTLKTTSGAGATGADMIFQVGSNGATEGLRILNSGVLQIGGSGDTNLYRSTTNTLKTDSNFIALTGLLGNVAIPGLYTATQEPTGLLDRTATLSWTDTTPDRTFTITGSHTIYINGVATTKTTTSLQIANTTGMHFIYYNSAGTLVENTTFPGFFVPYVASVYWNSSTVKGIVGEERHGITMDGATHSYLHNTIGTRYVSGLALSAITNTTFQVDAGSIADEDITITTTNATTCDVLYKNGSVDYQWDANQTALYGTSLRYNNVNVLTAVPTTNYSALWVFATNSITRPIAVVIGQRVDTTIANARTNNTYDTLVLGSLPFKEMKLLYRVLFRNVGGTATYQETADYRSVSNVPSGTYVATAHGSLSGLAAPADDHTQYALLAGRDAGQTLIGGTATSGALTLVGGALTTSPLTLKTTTGAGTTGADMIFQVGSNGATEGLRILNSGVLQVGGSGDTNLYRSAADTLKTDDKFVCAEILLTDNTSVTKGITFADGTRQTTIPSAAYWVAAGNDISNTNSGKVGIGTATIATGSFVNVRKDQNTYTSLFIQNYNSQESAQARLDLGFEIGSHGSITYDVTNAQLLLSTGANVGGGVAITTTGGAQNGHIRIAPGGTGKISVGGSNTTTPYFLVDVIGNIRIQGANYLYFGGAGAADNDVNLYRSNPNELKTDDSFVVGANLTVNGTETIIGGTTFGTQINFGPYAPATAIVTYQNSIETQFQYAYWNGGSSVTTDGFSLRATPLSAAAGVGDLSFLDAGTTERVRITAGSSSKLLIKDTLDTLTATTLSIGTATASAITLGTTSVGPTAPGTLTAKALTIQNGGGGVLTFQDGTTQSTAATTVTGAERAIVVPFTYTSMGGTVSSTATIPTSAKVLRTLVYVGTVFSGGSAPTAAVSVYNVGGSTTLQATTDNDLTTANQYEVPDYISVSNVGPVRVTLAGTASAGSGEVFVVYSVPST